MRRILAAASDWRSLIWLGAGVVAAAVLSNPFPALVGLGLFLWAVQRLAQSPVMEEAAERSRVANGLAERYRELQAAERQVLPRLPDMISRSEQRPTAMRAQDVLTAARSLYQQWLAQSPPDLERAQWVDEALQLSHLYLKMLESYQALFNAPRPQTDLRAVQQRVARNEERLAQTTDMEARRLLIQAIEMDQRVLEEQGDAEAAQERYLAKLAAIESTIDMLRRRIYEPDSGEQASRVHEMLLEAQAMDDAMTEVQHRTRVRAR